MKFGVPAGMSLFCMTCGKDVEVTVENGGTIYPNRPDLANHVFLRCPHCLNYVSAGQLRPSDTLKTWQKRFSHRTIPTQMTRRYRRAIHSIIDPLWKSGVMERGYIYKRLSEATGTDYHNGSVCDVEVMIKAYETAVKLRREAEIISKKHFRRPRSPRRV